MKPNFFIIGAPKSGTTSLARYLSEHSEIIFSDPKETGYFDTDLHTSSWANESSYLDEAYPLTEKKYRAVGEGTVWNLYSRVAVDNILQFNPNAKFIVLLRNPVQIFHSLYYHRYFSGRETASTFAKAWRIQKQRSYDSVSNPKTFLCADLYKLGDQLERLYKKVEKDRVLIIFFEDLKNNPALVYKRCLDFLEVSQDGKVDFEHVNPSRAINNKYIRNTVLFLRSIKKKLRINKPFGSTVLARRVVYQKKKPLPDTVRIDIQRFLLDDIRKIEKLANRQLSHWYEQ